MFHAAPSLSGAAEGSASELSLLCFFLKFSQSIELRSHYNQKKQIAAVAGRKNSFAVSFEAFYAAKLSHRAVRFSTESQFQNQDFSANM